MPHWTYIVLVRFSTLWNHSLVTASPLSSLVFLNPEPPK
jgi:hypothetical protein